MGKVKLEPMKKSVPLKKPIVAKAAKRSTKARGPTTKKMKKIAGGGGGKSGGKDGILTALAELKAVGMEAPSRTLVAHMAKYNGAEQAGFKKTLSQLSQLGLVEYGSNSTLAITPKGESHVPQDLDPPRTNADIHDRIKAMLPPKAACIFDVLADGDAHSRLEIAHATGYPNDKTAGFKKMLSSVGGLGFLEYPSSTTAQLKDTAFPFGREGSGGGGKAAAAASVKKEQMVAVKKEKAIVKKEPTTTTKRGAAATSPPTLPNNVSNGDEDEGMDDDDDDDEAGDDEMEQDEATNEDDDDEIDDGSEEANGSDSEWEG